MHYEYKERWKKIFLNYPLLIQLQFDKKNKKETNF